MHLPHCKVVDAQVELLYYLHSADAAVTTTISAPGARGNPAFVIDVLPGRSTMFTEVKCLYSPYFPIG